MGYETFSHKETNVRFSSTDPGAVRESILLERRLLEDYIASYPAFLSSLEPIPALSGAPAIALAMHRASGLAGVGPMAAVAGAIAEAAVRAVLEGKGRGGKDAKPEAVVENGGDIFLATRREVVVGLYAGKSSLSGRLGLSVLPEDTPVAVCSSSGTMGHSISFGRADLATVVARDGALADACATLAGNLVRTERDIGPALDRVCSVPGVIGALVILGEKIGMKGDLPRLVRIDDGAFASKITRDRLSSFRFGGEPPA